MTRDKQEVMQIMSKLFNLSKKLTISRAVELAELGAIPDKRQAIESKEDDELDFGVWVKSHTYDEYFLTCFINELGRSGMKDETELRDRLEELRDAENPNKYYSDGSKGPWAVSNKNNIETVKWLLNE